MADNKISKKNVKSTKELLALSKNVQSKLNTIAYGSGTQVDDSTRAAFESILNTLSSVVDDLDTNASGDIVGQITKIVDKNSGADAKEFNKIKDMLQDENNLNFIADAYKQNRFKSDIYDDYASIRKLIPQLKDAAESIRDNILSPDDMTKQVVSLFYSAGKQLDMTKDFGSKLIAIKKKYKFDNHLKSIVDDTLTYGEQFVAVIPYKDAFKAMLDKKDKPSTSTGISNTFSKLGEASSMDFVKNLEGVFSFAKLTKSGTGDAEYIKDMSERTITNYRGAYNLLEDYEIFAAQEQYNMLNETALDLSSPNFIANAYKMTADTRNDGHIDGALAAKDSNKNVVNIPGCIIKRLDIRKVVPIYINSMCLGYYYLETIETENIINNFDNPLNRLRAINDFNTRDTAEQSIYKSISNIIYKSMDKKFLEKNSEFKNMIYEFARYNDIVNKNVKITYIPANQMIHFKINPDENGRGCSIFDNILFPAKMYLSILICNIMMKISRSADKRAYYIKQGISSDIAQSVQYAIKELKKDQKSLSDINNINRLFSIVGKFSDLFIPVNEQGDKPIDFDIIAGQDTTVKDDLVEMLEEIIVNGTGVPLALMTASNDVDFAKTYAMLNAKFLRRTISQQIDLQDPTTDFAKAIARTELSDEADLALLKDIEARYPPPMSLSAQTGLEQFNNIKDLINNIIDARLGTNSPDPIIRDGMYRKLIKKYMPNIDWDEIDELVRQCVLEKDEEAIKAKQDADAGGDGSDSTEPTDDNLAED